MNNIIDQINHLPQDNQLLILQNILAGLIGQGQTNVNVPGTNNTENKSHNDMINQSMPEEIQASEMTEKDGKDEAHGFSKDRTQSKPAKYADYPDELKKEAVSLARESNNNRSAARTIASRHSKEGIYQNISERSIREWRWNPKYNDNYEEDLAKKNRTQKRETKGRYHAVEVDLIDKIKEKRARGLPVSRSWIKSEAINLVAEPTFVASDGWFHNFAKRWCLSLRVRTKVVQNLVADYAQQVLSFMENIRKERLAYEHPKKLKLIFGNVDQVPFQFDMGNGTTYEFEGKREISILRTTGIKQRFTVQLTILASGVFLPPLFVFKSRTSVPRELINKFKDKALIYSNSTGWVTKKIMLNYIDQIWLNLNINPAKEKLFLIADKLSVHRMDSVQRKIRDGGSLYQEIPASCTGLVQPLDTCINKPLKDQVRQRFRAWFEEHGHTQENLTKKKGNIKPPTPELMINWILKGCEEISPDLINKSFKHCVINHDMFGEENSLINKKLLVKDEICKYLSHIVNTKRKNPYDDTEEISTKIHMSDDTTYEIEDKEPDAVDAPSEEVDEEDYDPFNMPDHNEQLAHEPPVMEFESLSMGFNDTDHLLKTPLSKKRKAEETASVNTHLKKDRKENLPPNQPKITLFFSK